ncbi:hypothetical protein [Pseudomonas sp. TWI628]|uniref:hypothetical protein n=1 Tax=Pseudomonas sp. TWI628 TaxID=3136788 RepID=UPI00320B7CAC
MPTNNTDIIAVRFSFSSVVQFIVICMEEIGMSFDLLFAPEGYSTEVALIVAPYVDQKFMDKLVAKMRPKRLCLLVDDGIRPEDLQAIHGQRRRCVELEVRLARARGLMHMKAFYFEFVREGTPKRRKRRLLFGSANATHAAFQGKRNAELIAEVDLAIIEDSDVADYFSAILSTFDKQDASVVECAMVELSRMPTLYLPKFTSVIPEEAPSGFDAWLQRGVLAAQYRNAPQFATLNIQLKKALPQDLVARIFANRSFTEKGERNIVRYGYLNGSEDPALDGSDLEIPRWKSRYGVWTHLGDWISYECYRSHRISMKSKASSARNAKVSRLLGQGRDAIWREERIAALLSALEQVWSDLVAADVRPELYLEGLNGKLNPGIYRDRFIQKLEQDLHLAQDSDFRNRYVNGYEFPDMPRFRQDTAAWESFVRSWCESIAVEAAKNRTPSLVARRVRDVLEEKGLSLAELEYGSIASFLRKHWATEWEGEDLTLGEWVIGYHD